jgi:flagellin
MAFSLLTNVSSLEAQHNVNTTQSALQTSVERLSSGLRITHASDDAAGLAISARLGAQLGGLAQAQRNANDGVSMVQTAEAGLTDVNTLLTRMRELAVQSANGGTLGASDRASLNTEFVALQSEITRIVNVTSYNGQNLIDGSLSTGTSFQVGTFNSASNRISVSLLSADAQTLGINTGQTDVNTQLSAQNAIDLISTAINTVSTQRAAIGAVELRVAVTIDNLASTYTNLSAANSRISDVDVASETAALTKHSILLQAGISVLSQANQQPSAALSLLGR